MDALNVSTLNKNMKVGLKRIIHLCVLSLVVSFALKALWAPVEDISSSLYPVDTQESDLHHLECMSWAMFFFASS